MSDGPGNRPLASVLCIPTVKLENFGRLPGLLKGFTEGSINLIEKW